MYLTGQHNAVPKSTFVSDVTHVALAFMRSEIFNDVGRSEWPLFTTVAEVRPQFTKHTVIQVAIGGWGDTAGFEKAAETLESRELFAQNVHAMLDATGADGVDIDWEYPGGNGEDYKTNPNSGKEWQIAAYPNLLASIRAAIGPTKTISAAVPGLPRDMLAFTTATIPDIMDVVDFFNIMTYDLMNRRDNATKHHTGVANSIEALETYIDRGVPPEKANLGLAFYVRWFITAPGVDCNEGPIGCKTELMEGPNTGADLGQAGGFSWHDEVPSEVQKSFAKATANGTYDEEGGGYYYWDEEERRFWTWDTPEAIKRKFPLIVEKLKLGGVFAWGLGEDAPKFEHLCAANEGIRSTMSSTNVGRKYESRSEL
ncbi:42 kDa endochitinase-like protein [Setomelanomma holmii]|uniref:chitinase n=1 Tax=Setomelanomma holmii TaxID=210430 RepID=A0A9P4LNL2_9PLEO|nr:42 kDa endochitinase-like protein [Setomelanomma holmii]